MDVRPTRGQNLILELIGRDTYILINGCVVHSPAIVWQLCELRAKHHFELMSVIMQQCVYVVLNLQPLQSGIEFLSISPLVAQVLPRASFPAPLYQWFSVLYSLHPAPLWCFASLVFNDHPVYNAVVITAILVAFKIKFIPRHEKQLLNDRNFGIF